jgi:hypothetical protein
MVYRAIGVLFFQSDIMISFTEFHENAGKWNFELQQNKIYKSGTDQSLSEFIEENNLQFKVALITVHTEEPGIILNGASIAVATGLPVITDLALMDKELGGNGEFYKNCAEKLGIDEENIDDVNKSMCIAFMGILRWREEYNFLSSISGAKRNSIGGAVWLGQEA